MGASSRTACARRNRFVARTAIASWGVDGVDAPRRHLGAKVVVSTDHLKEASVGQASTIGLDIAKRVFQAHGADATGRAVFRKRLVRAKVLEFFAAQPPCVVALEA